MYLRCKTSQLQTHTLQGLESFLARHFACSSLPSQGHLQTKCMPGAPEPTGVRQGRHPRPGQGATSWALQACTQPCPGLCTLLCPACVITDVVAPGTEIKIRRRRGKKKNNNAGSGRRTGDVIKPQSLTGDRLGEQPFRCSRTATVGYS